MSTEVIDLRKGDRFVANEPVAGTFGAVDVVIVDLSLGGARISHPLAVKIGTRARLTFKRGDVSASVMGQVVWSHLSRAGNGMSYVSGMRLDGVEAQYAMAINSLLRAGLLKKDTTSMDRKRQLVAERGPRKTLSQPLPTPTGGVES